MTNPVTPFRNDLFGSRGMDIKAAMDYAETMISTFQGTEYAAAKTAIGVLVNTIESAVTQSKGPTPLEEALFEIIDKRIAVLQINTQVEINASIDDWMDNNLRDKMMDILANEDIDDDISNWMSNNFDITDYNVDDAIESWADNNLDEKIQDAIAKLNPGMSSKEFDYSLSEVNKIMQRAQQRAKDIAEGRPPKFEAEPEAPAAGGKSKFKVIGTEPVKAP